MNENNKTSLTDDHINKKNNKPKRQFDVADPLSEEAKSHCLNYTLKNLELVFLSEDDQKERIYSVFLKELEVLKQYVKIRPKEYWDTRFRGLLARHEANIRDCYSVFSKNSPKIQFQIDDAFSDSENINFTELEKIFKKNILTSRNIEKSTKTGAMYKAIKLIAQHQVAPPPWLANLMIDEISKIKEFQNYERKEKESISKARFISRLKSICLNTNNSIGIEDLINEYKLSNAKADTLRQKLAKVHAYNIKNAANGKVKYIALSDYPEISNILSKRAADYVIRSMKITDQSDQYGVSSLP